MRERNPLRQTLRAHEAEQSVIGALLIDNDAIDRAHGLRTEHFASGAHRAIVAEIIGQLQSGGAADVLTVFERLDAKGQADDIGGLAYLTELANNTPSSANIGRYAGIVRDRWLKRSALEVAADLQDAIENSPDAASALLDHAASRIEELGRLQERREAVSLRDAMLSHIEVIERRSDGAMPAMSTGLADLDTALNGGLRRGWNVVLAARPGMGKTALALNIALSVARDGTALFLSMEMPESEIVDRTIAQLGRVSLSDVMQPPGSPAFWEGLTIATSKVAERKLLIDDQGGLTLLDIRNKARSAKRKHGLDLLVVDYLQLMSGDGDNRNEQLSVISRGLKALAKELDICVITLSQLNRKSEERAGKLPQASDLRDSGAIEQDADVILLIHREEVSNPNCGEQWRGFALVRIPKNRHGPVTEVGLSYAGQWVTFSDRVGAWPSTGEVPRRHRGFEE